MPVDQIIQFCDSKTTIVYLATSSLATKVCIPHITMPGTFCFSEGGNELKGLFFNRKKQFTVCKEYFPPKHGFELTLVVRLATEESIDHACCSTLQIAVEGNIGCGKSTLLNHFQNSPTVEVSKDDVKLLDLQNGFNLKKKETS